MMQAQQRNNDSDELFQASFKQDEQDQKSYDDEGEVQEEEEDQRMSRENLDNKDQDNDEETVAAVEDSLIEQINLFSDRQEESHLKPGEQPLFNENSQSNDQRQELSEQDSSVFRVSSDVVGGADATNSITNSINHHQVEVNHRSHVLSSDQDIRSQQIGFNTIEAESLHNAHTISQDQIIQNQEEIRTEQTKKLSGTGTTSPSFTMTKDSFVGFPKSNASDQMIFPQGSEPEIASTYDNKSGNGKPFEFFAKSDGEDNPFAETPVEEKASEELKYSPSHVPTFNTTAEQSNKIVASMDLHNHQRPNKISQENVIPLNIEQLMTTEQADFEGVNADTQRNWRDLIRDNPFEANQSAHEQAPRDSLMMLAEAPGVVNPENFQHLEAFDDENLTRSDRFAQRVVSLGPHQYINQPEEFRSRSEVLGVDSGPSMASLVEMEHQKLDKRNKNNGDLNVSEQNRQQQRQNDSSEEDGDENLNENHSCEDEELVISPQETNMPNGHSKSVQQQYHVSQSPIETFAEQEDPYQSNQQELMLYATNEERNADLNNNDHDTRKKFSSLEDGEVRDEDDDYDEKAYEDAQQKNQHQQQKQQQMKFSESEVNDENDFFCGGNKQGELIDFQPENYAYSTDKQHNNNMVFDHPEPLVGSTLNLFKLSGKNLPTETDQYESSVYQTPELNPQQNDSTRQQKNDTQHIIAIKQLNYDSNSNVVYERCEEPMSTMTKARPGCIQGQADSGSDENVLDSNDSSFAEDDQSPDMHLENAGNPFKNGSTSREPQQLIPSNIGTNRQTFGGSQRQSIVHQDKTLQAMASEDYLVQGAISFDEGDPMQLYSHRQPSITAVLDDDEHGPRRRTIQASNGKRRRRSAKEVKQTTNESNNSYSDTKQKLEHTFGDGEISLEVQDINNSKTIEDMPSMENESNIPWLHSKQDISISNDSMFNMHDEEVKKMLKDDQLGNKTFKLSQINNNLISESEVKKEIPEVDQLVTFITQIEQLWVSLCNDQQYASLIKDNQGGSQKQQFSQSENIANSPDKRGGVGIARLAFPAEVSSKLTHQITQITVFYQLNQDKEGFRLPTRKVSSIARLAKQIVVQDKINIPRQTRSQFTLTVLDMLKQSQDYVLRRKQEKQQHSMIMSKEIKQNGTLTFQYQQDPSIPTDIQIDNTKLVSTSGNQAAGMFESSSDFLSVTSNFTQQNAELTNELMAQAELLRSPPDYQQVEVQKKSYKKGAQIQRNSKGKGKSTAGAEVISKTGLQHKKFQSQNANSSTNIGLTRVNSSKRNLQQTKKLKKGQHTSVSHKSLQQQNSGNGLTQGVGVLGFKGTETSTKSTQHLNLQQQQLGSKSVPSLDLASVNNALQIQQQSQQNKQAVVAREQLRMNDQMLLQNTDLKSQLKMLRKGMTSAGSKAAILAQTNSNCSQSQNSQSAQNIGINRRLSQHKDSLQQMQMANIDQLAEEINQSLHIEQVDVDVILEREGPQSVQNLSFGENQSNSSKQSLGYGAVQSMDGRRQKSKSTKRTTPHSMATSSLSNLKLTKKTSSKGNKGGAFTKGNLQHNSGQNLVQQHSNNQAQLEADQIMFDLFKGVSSENPSSMANMQNSGAQQVMGQNAVQMAEIPKSPSQSFDPMAFVEETKKDKKKAPVRSQQNRCNMPQNQNLAKKHKRLVNGGEHSTKGSKATGSAAAGNHLKAPSHVIGGNSSAIPYRVSRVAQPTQHKSFQVIAENNLVDEDDDEFDDTWI